MNAHVFQVTLRATEPGVSPNAPIAAARLISLMPDGWCGRLEYLADGPVVVIETPDLVPVDIVVIATRTALADAAMRGWELAGCLAI